MDENVPRSVPVMDRARIRAMNDTTERGLPERTGRHFCTRCLGETPAEEYLEYDHLCRKCAGEGDYPLRSTPGAGADGDE